MIRPIVYAVKGVEQTVEVAAPSEPWFAPVQRFDLSQGEDTITVTLEMLREILQCAEGLAQERAE